MILFLNFSHPYKIIWDNDDVLAPSGDLVIKHFNKHTGKNISGGHYTQFQKLYEISAEEETRLFDLFATENTAGDINPVDGIPELLTLLYKNNCIHYVCTARPKKIYRQATRNWLSQHFPESINLKNLSMFEGDNEQHYRFNKLPFFEEVEGDIFIDDSIHNIKAIADGCKRDVLIMFQRTKHNTHVLDSEIPKNVIVIPDNKQADHILDAIIDFDNRKSKNTPFIDASIRDFTNS